MRKKAPNADHRARRRATITPLEVQQNAEITALRLELRALRTELRTRPSKPLPTRRPTVLDYGNLLDMIWEPLERLLAKGKTIHGTCSRCNNIALPCLLPLFEGERMEYAEGEYDDLIYSPILASGGISAVDPEHMKATLRVAMHGQG